MAVDERGSLGFTHMRRVVLTRDQALPVRANAGSDRQGRHPTSCHPQHLIARIPLPPHPSWVPKTPNPLVTSPSTSSHRMYPSARQLASRRDVDADDFSLRRDAPVRFSNELVDSLQKNTQVRRIQQRREKR